MTRHLPNLPVQSQTGIKFVQQDAQNPQAGVIAALNCLNGLLDLGNAKQAENFRSHGDDQRVGYYIGVDSQHVQRRGSVDDDVVIAVFHQHKLVFQQKFPSGTAEFQICR